MAQLLNLIRGATLGAALALPAGAQEQETEPAPDIDPQALEIVEAAADFLVSQPVLQVSWFVSYDDVIDGREKITQLRSGVNLLDRDNGFVAETQDGLQTRSFFFDGASFTVYDVEEDAYAQIPFFGDYELLIDRMRDEYDLTLPIWSVLSSDHKGEFVESADQIAYLGLTRIAGEVVHHVALSNYDSDWQIWIADDDAAPVIRMIVGTDPYVQGWPQFRAYFNEWDFAPEIEEGTFSFEPGEDTERMVWPRRSDNVSTGGQ